MGLVQLCALCNGNTLQSQCARAVLDRVLPKLQTELADLAGPAEKDRYVAAYAIDALSCLVAGNLGSASSTGPLKTLLELLRPNAVLPLDAALIKRALEALEGGGLDALSSVGLTPNVLQGLVCRQRCSRTSPDSPY